ncbi:AraC family transcriptional regulator [Cytophagaceae bacterium DM2B3-1]|uniref:AraC family transcriptional regulator n=1 Tax=Xanthocytophaga flava TaxID=3048013 RepID=A0AAE3QZF5_9BACT|nr:AraC family transcriptional regulator [Xanthocytophaga flavus]MDJ1473637.1 AraC family transcriptional regulator [Xanthocytophaga flavus]MDJ1485559.1 AraC family transcriptional regulator [Xanthocytophaga flavus]MDJ1498666.1 AraC family transcriptional regulator [Xanthocytophaga flavus]
MIHLYHEVTPLTPYDCFTIFERFKTDFNFPFHYHEEFELNLILNASNAKRVIGDHSGVIGDYELVLVGSNLPHAWFTHQCKSEQIHEVTIQFHRDFLDAKFLQRNQLVFIKNMLEQSSRGISFSKETIMAIKDRLINLTRKSGFDSVLELMSILHDLSISRNIQALSTSSFAQEQHSYNSRRIRKAFEYMQVNCEREITLKEVADLVGMTEVSFCRFIKKRTGKTFVESLNQIRLGYACRMLIDSTQSIAEISYKCGFNNLSYFNRLFKKQKGCTPKKFRENFSGTRAFI